MKSVYSAVRTGSLNKAIMRFVFERLRKLLLGFYGIPSVRLTVSVFSFYVSSCSLFDDAASTPEDIRWNFRIISKLLIGKYVPGSGRG